MKWLKRICDQSIPLSSFHNESLDWGTCVIGEAREASFSGIPSVAKALRAHGPHGGPADSTLTKLGIAFHRAVWKDNRLAAKKAYLAIQTRLIRLSGRLR